LKRETKRPRWLFEVGQSAALNERFKTGELRGFYSAAHRHHVRSNSSATGIATATRTGQPGNAAGSATAAGRPTKATPFAAELSSQTALAATDLDLLWISGTEVEKLCERNPGLSLYFLRLTATRTTTNALRAERIASSNL
jgi:hypothetical protein